MHNQLLISLQIEEKWYTFRLFFGILSCYYLQSGKLNLLTNDLQLLRKLSGKLSAHCILCHILQHLFPYAKIQLFLYFMIG